MMRLGVLCPSEIAFRRFMPALVETDFVYIGLAINSPKERFGEFLPSEREIKSMLEREEKKAADFVDKYGGKIFNSYEDIICSNEIDALYIPLPPGLHYKWAKKALEAGKHVLLEKPFTTKLKDTNDLINLAAKKELAIHENYMFSFHSQIESIDKIIKDKSLGEIRSFSIKFGFPMRSSDDFRYNKSLGGGSIMDAGGYCVKYATHLLGSSTKVVYSHLNYKKGFDVDMFGSGVLANDEGLIAQVTFGMDNDYKCELEIWGSLGTLRTGRILTAPPDFEPTLYISRNGEIEEIKLTQDNSFKKSILRFKECILNIEERNENYENIKKQAELVEEFIKG